MKYHFLTKLLAVILAVVCVTGVILSGICVIYNLEKGLYASSPTEQSEDLLLSHAMNYADQLAEQYAYELSGLPLEVWESSCSMGTMNWHVWPEVDYCITIRHQGNVTEDDHAQSAGSYYRNETIWVSMPACETAKVGSFQVDEEPTVPAGETDPTDATYPTMPVGAHQLYAYTDDNGDLFSIYRHEEELDITVELYYTKADYQSVVGSRYADSGLMRWMYSLRLSAIIVLLISTAGLLLMMTYLAAAAGRNPRNDEVRPAGLNRLPLDLYTVLDLFLGFWLCWLLVEGVLDELLDLASPGGEAFFLLLLCAGGLSALIGLVCILYWCALCAQLKADGFWWKKSILGRFGDTMWNLVKRIWRKLWGGLMGLTGKVGEQVPSFTAFLRDLNNKLPLIWQWLSISALMMVLLAIFGAYTSNPGMMFLYWIIVCLCLGMIAYGARSFGELRQAAKRMSQGELDVKINADVFEGGFHDFAVDLNALSDACITAAREQLKSERMKTELITNVSHDIKTPLTSIINYVDLLKKAETEAERQEYLEVLERQSAQLKKLIEDLMEMSKATTGNLAVEIVPTDVAESVNQAMGEFADRLASRNLTVVLRKSGDSVMALCDGKHLWRVLSNLLNNVVKYALPGTRVYLDLTETEHRVNLSLKNISAEELNVTAEELMERFVRGDASRNTEGNGLGLNIAKSLMDSQGGTLDLTVDGDLFKVMLTLPRAE